VENANDRKSKRSGNGSGSSGSSSTVTHALAAKISVEATPQLPRPLQSERVGGPLPS
jgi:hypothetical protein